MKIAVIGYGNMGSAIVDGWLSNEICKPSNLLVFKIDAKKIKELEDNGVQTTVNNYKLLKEQNILLLAVKPQDLKGVLNKIKNHINPKTIIITVITGVTIDKYEKVLGDVKIIRTMPNIPVQIGMGTIGWTINKQVDNKDKEIAKTLIESMGHAIFFSDENKMNAVSAISGSGPAYIFYFMEAMFEAGCTAGLSPQEASELTLSTFVGSSLMIHELGASPVELRRKVTSKDGITEAAIRVFEENNLKKIISDAVQANATFYH